MKEQKEQKEERCRIKSNVFNVDGKLMGVDRGDKEIIFNFYPDIEIRISNFSDIFAQTIVKTGLSRLKNSTLDFDKQRVILDPKDVSKNTTK